MARMSSTRRRYIQRNRIYNYTMAYAATSFVVVTQFAAFVLTCLYALFMGWVIGEKGIAWVVVNFEAYYALPATVVVVSIIIAAVFHKINDTLYDDGED